MHDDEAARREHIRRWVRPDFERFLRPDWERYVHPAGRERRLRQIAEYKAAFEPPSTRRLREQNEAREREEQAALERKLEEFRRERVERERAWETECAARKLKADLAWERFTTTLARYLEQQRLARKYSPDQPRVPAGSSEGGQWTSGDGNNAGAEAATANDEDDGSSDGADEDAAPELVQDRSDRLLNNHIIRDHVAKTDEELKARIRADQTRGLFLSRGMDRNGSFDSIESARDFISQTIANNPGGVAQVATGQTDGKFLVWRFGYHTGREAIMDAPGSEIRMRPTYEVGVLIVHDPRADFGYRVVTAFPRNFNPRTGR